MHATTPRKTSMRNGQSSRVQTRLASTVVRRFRPRMMPAMDTGRLIASTQLTLILWSGVC